VTLNSFPFLQKVLLFFQLEKKFIKEELHSPEVGISFLSQTLRELYLSEHTTKPKRNQQFVTLPHTVLPENLDMRGPQAICLEEVFAFTFFFNFFKSLKKKILSRMKPTDSLIKKFFDRCSHYTLVTRTIDFLQNYLIQFSDPQVFIFP
jgi:hypothetical protein